MCASGASNSRGTAALQLLRRARSPARARRRLARPGAPKKRGSGSPRSHGSPRSPAQGNLLPRVLYKKTYYSMTRHSLNSLTKCDTLIRVVHLFLQRIERPAPAVQRLQVARQAQPPPAQHGTAQRQWLAVRRSRGSRRSRRATGAGSAGAAARCAAEHLKQSCAAPGSPAQRPPHCQALRQPGAGGVDGAAGGVEPARAQHGVRQKPRLVVNHYLVERPRNLAHCGARCRRKCTYFAAGEGRHSRDVLRLTGRQSECKMREGCAPSATATDSTMASAASARAPGAGRSSAISARKRARKRRSRCGSLRGPPAPPPAPCRSSSGAGGSAPGGGPAGRACTCSVTVVEEGRESSTWPAGEGQPAGLSAALRRLGRRTHLPSQQGRRRGRGRRLYDGHYLEHFSD